MADSKELVRQYGRRRVFTFLAVFIFIAMLLDAFAELDVARYAVDDFAVSLISLVMLIVFAVMRKRDSLEGLKRQNTIAVVLIVIMIFFQIYGLVTEASSPEDFGDEIPVLIGLVIMLLNGFL